ncbi:MAG: ArsR/SmtB family transcription factor, partial [Persicimonas sp.]
ANTSAHLKVLKRAHLVESRKEGRRKFYSLAGDSALHLWLALRDMGLQELPEVREAMRDHASEPALLPDLAGEELLEKVRSGDVVLLDLRPAEEYESGHIPYAQSLPGDQLEERLEELPEDRTVVAYCRGPYCVAAIKSVDKLREAGFEARRLAEGVAEWKAAGHPLEVVEEA